MEVGEGQELENNEEIDKMADKDMIKNNDVTDRLEVMFMMVERTPRRIIMENWRWHWRW